MTHLFISYAKVDTHDLAFALYDALHTPPDITVWVDQELKVIGLPWSRQIEREIDRCHYMLVLLSPEVNRRDDGPKGESFVRKEIRYAQQKNKPIVPIMAQATDLPFDLTGQQYIDATNYDPKAIEPLVEGICKEIGISTPQSWKAAQSPLVLPSPTTPAALPSTPPASRQWPTLDQRILGILIGVAVVIIGLVFGSQVISQLIGAPSMPTLPALIPAGANSNWQPVISDFGGVPMVQVPAGCFKMGSNFDNEKPIHEVCITRTFWIDQFEVSNKQYGSAGYFKGDNRPRETVSWDEAKAFCEKHGGRLPTEAEREYAARGPQSRLYPWGDTFVAANAIFAENSNNQTAEVGPGIRTAGQSWVGAHDMSGNVSEWVADWYDENYYKNSPKNDPQGPASGRSHAVRGGGWNFPSDNLRAPNRGWGDIALSYGGIGFRCARSS